VAVAAAGMAAQLSARRGLPLLGAAGALALGAWARVPAAARSEAETPAGPVGCPAEDWPGVVENWSGTHACQARRLWRPRSQREVEAAVAQHGPGSRLRVVGSALSPNGLALGDGDLLSLESMKRVLSVDRAARRVTVECGAQVGEVLDALREHGLTLNNLASINLQQVGGFVQAGAHGTGATLPPAEETVVSMRIVTPGAGTLELSETSHPELFRFAKLGLGCFGVVTQVTLQCVDAHRLREETRVMTTLEVEQGHAARLKANKHVRYMWLPYTDAAVVVTSNPCGAARAAAPAPSPAAAAAAAEAEAAAHALRVAPLVKLLREADSADPQALAPHGVPPNAERLGFAELRDLLLRVNGGQLATAHVAAVNRAELEYWRASQGVREAASEDVLAFECGGQQLVLEVAVPAGTLAKPDGRDLAFVRALIKAVEAQGLPAPAPIEQRWTCGSAAAMSPVGPGNEGERESEREGARASTATASRPHEQLHSWVGIIMYLPEREMRTAVENKFYGYRRLLDSVDKAGRFGARTHWAKIEMPWGREELEETQERLRSLFPIREWEAHRAKLDPYGVMLNPLLDALLRGVPLRPSSGAANLDGEKRTFVK
jgi:L-galactono-1,4-lactone dehydrogenase